MSIVLFLALLLTVPSVVFSYDLPAPATIIVQANTATLSNSLLTLTVDLTNAQCITLYSSLMPGTNLLYDTNGPCEWDQEPPEIRPSNLKYTIVRNDSDFVQVHMYDGDTPGLASFHWSFDYAVAAGVSGIYVWGEVSHPSSLRAAPLKQYRWMARLSPGTSRDAAVVDSVGVRPDVQRLLPTVAEAEAGKTMSPQEAESVTLSNGTQTVEHKYDYCLDSIDHQVHGLFHSKTKLGVWTLSPGFDYHNGAFDAQDLTSYGPTSFTGLYFAHIQMLNGGHYGSGDETVSNDWSKLFGPWLWYINKGNDTVSPWDDAMNQYNIEANKWPYKFINNTGYPAESRGALMGQLVVTDVPDPRAPTPSAANALVFLTEPTAIHGRYTDQSQGYTYWVYTDSNGNFNLTNIRAATYELHVTVNGVIGELGGQIITIKAGSVTDVKTITYEVPRNATTVWEIGYPDRSAQEYKHGDQYRYWGLYNLFDTDFPNSVQYYINSSWRQPASQWRNDWNYAHVPMNNKPKDWSIYFDIPEFKSQSNMNGYLRIAFAGVVHCQLTLSVNGKSIPSIEDLNSNDNSVYRDAIHGIYQYRTVVFDSSILMETSNVLVLTNQCSATFDGILYDAMRFELDGWSPPPEQINDKFFFSE